MVIQYESLAKKNPSRKKSTLCCFGHHSLHKEAKRRRMLLLSHDCSTSVMHSHHLDSFDSKAQGYMWLAPFRTYDVADTSRCPSILQSPSPYMPNICIPPIGIQLPHCLEAMQGASKPHEEAVVLYNAQCHSRHSCMG